MRVKGSISRKERHWDPFAKKPSSKLKEESYKEEGDENNSTNSNLGSNIEMEGGESEPKLELETPAPTWTKSRPTTKSAFKSQPVLKTPTTTDC